MNQAELNEILEQHKLWIDTDGKEGKRALMDYEDMINAVVMNVDMKRVDMRHADMSDVDMDYSCWPLWCGSLDVKVDARIARQLAYHFCRLVCDDPEYISARNALVDFANGFHRVEDCGRLERIEADKS